MCCAKAFTLDRLIRARFIEISRPSSYLVHLRRYMLHSAVCAYTTDGATDYNDSHLTRMLDTTIQYSAALTYNTTPSNIIEKLYSHGFEGFSLYIKRLTIQSYNGMCTVAKCYSCRRNNTI